MEINKIYCGDSLEVLKTFSDKSVNCCITSPPYWGLRDYGVEGQLGLEKTPQEYVDKMVELFREVRRVLKDDGTLWLNLGDSYCGTGDKGDTTDPKYADGRNYTTKGRNLQQILSAKDSPHLDRYMKQQKLNFSDSTIIKEYIDFQATLQAELSAKLRLASRLKRMWGTHVEKGAIVTGKQIGRAHV